MREFRPELIREWERSGIKLDFGDMLDLANYIESLITENSDLRDALICAYVNEGCSYEESVRAVSHLVSNGA